MLFIVAGTGIVYLVDMMDTTGTFLYYFYFSPELIARGEVWRLFSFLLLPRDSNPFFLLISLYFYYFIGSSLERQWGTPRFTIYYIFGWFFNVIYGLVMYFVDGYYMINMDAYYLNLSLFFAFAAMWPDQQVLLMFIIPVKMKWLAWLDAALFAIDIIRSWSVFPYNLLPLVSILNFLLFCGPSLLDHFKGGRRNYSRHIRFEVNNNRNERRHEKLNYHHKCSVCGKTDTEYPNLEFRYCSKCVGYHCFCEEHINNHVHFTE